MSEIPYKKIHVIINPASGKDEPILNVLNDTFNKYGVEWSIDVTKKYGDATIFARRAAESGADLVAGYGGDGTQHEIANGILGTDAVMGVLPGGTGNGFATELGTPKTLAAAVELLCTSHTQRHIDVVKMDDSYFIQRMYIGIEPEAQTSREDKNKYGTFAYAINAYHQGKADRQSHTTYKLTIDGETAEFPASKLYVVNAAKAGTGISITGNISKPDDGILEVFILDAKNIRTLAQATTRMLHLNRDTQSGFLRQGKEIHIETTPDQPIWADGEYVGRTPISMNIVPGALAIAVP